MPRKFPIKRSAPTAPSSAEASEDAAATLEEGLSHLSPGMRGKIAQSRARGLTMREQIYELHVCQSRPMSEVGRILGLSRAGAHHHWNKLKAEIVANATHSPEDFTFMRERICATLWQAVRRASLEMPPPPPPPTVEVELDANTGVAVPVAVPVPVPAPPTRPTKEAALVPHLLAVQIKALDQLARLYDLGLDTRSPAYAPVPYATPEEITASVRERLLAMHGRSSGDT